jgi:hypothetical protein
MECVKIRSEALHARMDKLKSGTILAPGQASRSFREVSQPSNATNASFSEGAKRLDRVRGS